MDDTLAIPFLLVLAGAIGALVVAAVVIRRKAAEARQLAAPGSALQLWSCPSCGTQNAGDRPDCFACHTPRTTGGSGGPG